MTNLKGKVALITGSARGVGKAIAERYASLGADIVINYTRDKSSAEDTVENIKKLGVKVLLVQADVSKVSEVEEMFKAVLRSFGKIDLVVANAGVEIVDQSALDFTEEQFDRLFGINSKGAFFTLQQAARHVADHGRIIYIGSSTTAFPLPGVALYGGSKMAPRFLVEVLAKELGKRGIAVNSIIPTALAGAGVFTDVTDEAPIKKLMEKSFCPMGRMGTPEDVANVAEFFASELSAFVSGQHLLISGGGPC
jgi:3-oxoacyl-[acyl-carrier protein] reductase